MAHNSIRRFFPGQAAVLVLASAFSVSAVQMAVEKVALEQIPNLRAAQEVLPANV